MNDAAPATPPAHVRTVTLEDLDRRVTQLERHDSETYALLRDLSAKIDKNHLVTMDTFGELARMLGKSIVEKKPEAPR